MNPKLAMLAKQDASDARTTGCTSSTDSSTLKMKPYIEVQQVFKSLLAIRSNSKE